MNVRGRDVGGFVADARQQVAAAVALPSGYRLEWGGQFENQARATARLQLLARVGELLKVELDSEQRLHRIAQMMLPELADGSAVYLLDNGRLDLVAAGHPDPVVQALSAGEEITDSFTAVSQDGSATQLVTVTITGTNDVPVITGADIEAARRMNARLVHRGPDSEGEFVADGVALAMRRLSIIDLEHGDQPIANEDGSVVVIQNGEIYNYRELRHELEARGHRFRTASDTEVLVHLYEQHGEGFAERLRGMFAIAIWDARERRLLLARDRFGIKPLYYRVAGGALSFASELKALLEQPGFSREIDPRAVAAYLAFNSILVNANRSLARLAVEARIAMPEGLQRASARTEPALDELWDDSLGQYFSRDAVTGSLLRLPTIATFLPLLAGVVAPERVARLAAKLRAPSGFWPRFPVPTVPTDAAWFREEAYWKGPTWVNMNWFLVEALTANQAHHLASALIESTLRLVDDNGFFEYFSPLTGRGYGARAFSWTAALTLDLIARRRANRLLP